MKYFKVLPILFIIITFLINSCDNKVQESVTDTEDTSKSEYVSLAKEKQTEYKIIRPDNATDLVIETAKEFKNNLETLTGAKFKIETDWINPKEEYDSDAKEILIGETNREESIAAKNALEKNSYSITVIGNKIVIVGDNDILTKEAAKYFFDEDSKIIRHDTNETGEYLIMSDTDYRNKNESYGVLTMYDGGEYVGIYDCNDGAYLALIKNTNLNEYNDFLAELEAMNFTKYTSNVIDNKNYYNTYVTDQLTVNAYYTGANNLVRIIHEPRTTLPALESENKYEKTVETWLTQIKLEDAEVSEGSSYVIRLADNSFIIIDGGWSDKNNVEATKLLNILREQSGVQDGEKIDIAAWIFTHAHGDHIGTFNGFIKSYHDKVNIEQLIYNFPTDKEIKNSDAAFMLDSTLNRLPVFRANLKEHLSNVPVIKAHSGQKYFIRNATIEVLNTFEDNYPLTIETQGMNSSSVVFVMELEGQRIMFLGDSENISTDNIVKQMGTYLKSDFMTPAHHGFHGGTVELYSLIDPTVVLWTAPKNWYNEFISQDYNKYFLESKNVKKIFTMCFGTFTLKMPYTVADNDSEKIANNGIFSNEHWYY